MNRLWLIAPLALILIASGCFGGSTAGPSSSPPKQAAHSTPSPRAYARFQIHGVYPTGSGKNTVGGDLHRAHFTLTCDSERTYLAVQGLLSRPAQLCVAILDYWTQIPLQLACRCPASPVFVDVRGTVHGRTVHERVTPCLCGDGPQAARDARVMLTTSPPV